MDDQVSCNLLLVLVLIIFCDLVHVPQYQTGLLYISPLGRIFEFVLA